jgi:hypothetical protein
VAIACFALIGLFWNPARSLASAATMADPLSPQAWTGSLVELSLAIGQGSNLVHADLLAGQAHAVTGLTVLALGLALHPSFDRLLAGQWRDGLGRSVLRVGTLALAGVGYVQMMQGPDDQRQGWALLFQLGSISTGALLVWDVLDAAPDNRLARSLPAVDLSLGPLILPPPPGSAEATPPALGVSFSGWF